MVRGHKSVILGNQEKPRETHVNPLNIAERKRDKEERNRPCRQWYQNHGSRNKFLLSPRHSSQWCQNRGSWAKSWPSLRRPSASPTSVVPSNTSVLSYVSVWALRSAAPVISTLSTRCSSHLTTWQQYRRVDTVRGIEEVTWSSSPRVLKNEKRKHVDVIKIMPFLFQISYQFPKCDVLLFWYFLYEFQCE